MLPRKRLCLGDVLEVLYNDSDSETSLVSSDNESDSSEENNLAVGNDHVQPHPPIANVIVPNPANHNPPQPVNPANHNPQPVFNWEPYAMEDPYFPDWLPDYQRRRGVLVDTSDFVAVDYFKLFFPNEAIQLLCTETNRYAGQFFDNPSDLGPYSRYNRWKDTSTEEISAMIALQISMGLCAKPEISEYWNGFWLTKNDVPSVMTRNRYQLLQSFFHVNDNTIRVERGAEGYNPLFKIQPLLDLIEPLYQQHFCPGRNICIDESMIKYKGRLFFKQYMPAKPTKWGIKVFALCDSKTGYALRHMYYTGKQSFPREQGIGLAEQIVVDLLEGYNDKGHIVTMDNYYSNPVLFNKLERKGIGAVGTVQYLRKQMPEGLKPRNLVLRKGDPPVFYRSGNLVACGWQDTKRVTFLSTVDTDNTIDKRIRSKTDATGYRTIEKPVIGDRYNSTMAGVDLYDQMLGTYAYPHKCLKWYHAIYHRLIETALVNGYIVYRESREEQEKQMDAIAFRKNVIEGLLKDYDSKVVQSCRTVPNEYVRLKERHFIEKYENPKHKPDCKVCASMRPRVRKQTSYYCPDCSTPLCIVPCFKLFHTFKDFQRARERYYT